MVGYIGFGNNTLGDLPEVKKGDEVHCPHCNGRHLIECGRVDGVESNLLMFYHCGERTYLAAVKGRLIAHSKPDCSGKI